METLVERLSPNEDSTRMSKGSLLSLAVQKERRNGEAFDIHTEIHRM